MPGKKLFFQLYPYFLLVLALSAISTLWFSSATFRNFYVKSLQEAIETRTSLVAMQLEPLIIDTDAADLQRGCMEIASKAKGRLTVLDRTGKVLFDSEEDASKMPNHAGRPEFAEALNEKPGSSVRFSTTLHKDMIYVALPLNMPASEQGDGGSPRILGAVRLSVPTHQVDSALGSLYLKVTAGGIAISIVVAILSLAISRTLSRPIEDMKRSARRIAEGDLDCRMPVPDSEELGDLAIALNHMAGQLKLRLKDITRERNERETILSGMDEGVIAIDADACLIGLNKAAQRLLAIPDSSLGRTIYELVRNTSIQNFVSRLLSGAETLEEELDFHTGEERNYQIRGSILKDPQSVGPLGALIVISDITKIRRLEGVRRDFVANVSHEIKTPITAIKGSVETLLSGGAMSEPESAERFLRIIEKHSERLDALVSDILSLSSIESGIVEGQLNFTQVELKDVIDTATDLCREKAEAKGVRIDVSFNAPVQLKADKALLEQAVVNLLDNAIKYSPEGSSVELSASATGKSQAEITVRDSGCGIPKEHIPRLFERFYRVDKARSRKLGGTGLGLAIVKHIVKAHNGSAEVESAPGKGSAFIIALPL